MPVAEKQGSLGPILSGDSKVALAGIPKWGDRLLGHHGKENDLEGQIGAGPPHCTEPAGLIHTVVHWNSTLWWWQPGTVQS